MKRLVSFLFLLGMVALPSHADGKRQLQQLSAQLPILWNSYRPACVMALQAEQQLRIEPRLLFMETQIHPDVLMETLNNVGAPVLTAVWDKPAWQRMALLESEALQSELRENLREYLFKLQVNKPNQTRGELISQLQQTSQQLNLALREGLWKTCHALGVEGMAMEQAEAMLDARWQKQSDKVLGQIEKELNGFYFFTYRQISNEELQQFAQLQLQIQPWTESMTAAINQHFADLRALVMAQSMGEPMNPETASEPFPSDRPWTPEPSRGPLQP